LKKHAWPRDLKGIIKIDATLDKAIVPGLMDESSDTEPVAFGHL
jgi:hypothetical protein